jgi:PAS domain-containing protein
MVDPAGSNRFVGMRETIPWSEERAERVALALRLPVLVVDANLEFLFVNPAAEQFFGASAAHLYRHGLGELFPPKSPLLATLAKARSGAVSQQGVSIAARWPVHGRRDRCGGGRNGRGARSYRLAARIHRAS